MAPAMAVVCGRFAIVVHAASGRAVVACEARSCAVLAREHDFTKERGEEMTGGAEARAVDGVRFKYPRKAWALPLFCHSLLLVLFFLLHYGRWAPRHSSAVGVRERGASGEGMFATLKPRVEDRRRKGPSVHALIGKRYDAGNLPYSIPTRAHIEALASLRAVVCHALLVTPSCGKMRA